MVVENHSSSPWQEELAHRGGGGLLRWVNIGHFFSFSFSTKRGTNPLGAPLMRSAYSMRKFRPRWTSPSSLLFFWSNLLFFSLSPVSFSRSFFWFGDPEFGVSSYLLFFQSRQEEGNDGPSLVKVIGENEARCTEYTAAEITYFHLLCSLRCFHPTRRRGKQWHLISFQYQKNFLWLCVCIGFPSPFHSVIFQNTLHIQHEKWLGDGWWQQSQ